jgi:hypothetical protein
MRITIAYGWDGQWLGFDDDGKIIFMSEENQSVGEFYSSLMACVLENNTYGVTEVLLTDHAELVRLLEHPTAKPDNDPCAGLTGHRALLMAFGEWSRGEPKRAFKID